MASRISASATLSARASRRAAASDPARYSSRSMLLGLPTSMAVASVCTVARGVQDSPAKNAPTASLALVASTTGPTGRPHAAPTGRPARCRGCRWDHEAGRRAGLAPQRLRGPGVIRHLRQQPADADAVGGGQPRQPAQLRVGEGFLDHALAVVEIAVDPEAQDVVAPAGQLRFLPVRHAPLRVEQHHAKARPAIERRGHRPAGVAGGRHQHGARPPAASRARLAARKRAPTSLKAAVGPWNSSSTRNGPTSTSGVGKSSASAHRSGRAPASGSPARNGASTPLAVSASESSAGATHPDRAPGTLRHVQPAVGRQARQHGVLPAGHRRRRAAGAQVAHQTSAPR
jgi:hypothetical protein